MKPLDKQTLKSFGTDYFDAWCCMRCRNCCRVGEILGIDCKDCDYNWCFP